MKTLYLIRHGEAAASWDTNPDPGLSDSGRVHAESIVETFSLTEVSSVYSSPMLRAQETALPLARSKERSISLKDTFREIPTPPEMPLAERLSWLKRCAQSSWEQADPAVMEWRNQILHQVFELPTDSVVFSHFMVMNVVYGFLQQTSSMVSYQPDYCSVLTLHESDARWCVLDAGIESSSRIL